MSQPGHEPLPAGNDPATQFLYPRGIATPPNMDPTALLGVQAPQEERWFRHDDFSQVRHMASLGEYAILPIAGRARVYESYRAGDIGQSLRAVISDGMGFYHGLGIAVSSLHDLQTNESLNVLSRLYLDGRSEFVSALPHITKGSIAFRIGSESGLLEPVEPDSDEPVQFRVYQAGDVQDATNPPRIIVRHESNQLSKFYETILSSPAQRDERWTSARNAGARPFGGVIRWPILSTVAKQVLTAAKQLRARDGQTLELPIAGEWSE